MDWSHVFHEYSIDFTFRFDVQLARCNSRNQHSLRQIPQEYEDLGEHRQPEILTRNDQILIDFPENRRIDNCTQMSVSLFLLAKFGAASTAFQKFRKWELMNPP